MCSADPLRAALAGACAQTGPTPELRATASSGGLHPVSASGHRLRTDHAIAAAKYGPAGPLCAELDLGAALEAAAVLLGPQGLRPAVVGVEVDGGSVLQLVAEPCPGAEPACPDLTRALAQRRSIRSFRPTLGVPVPAPRTHRGPTGQEAMIEVADVRTGGPLPPGDLVQACARQNWVGHCAWAALVHLPGDPTPPAAWAIGAAAFRLHLEAHAAGLGSCIIGAVDPAAPELWDVPPETVGLAVVVVAGLPA